MQYVLFLASAEGAAKPKASVSLLYKMDVSVACEIRFACVCTVYDETLQTPCKPYHFHPSYPNRHRNPEYGPRNSFAPSSSVTRDVSVST